MANFMYTHAKAGIMSGAIDLDTDDIRVLMVMSNTTADTEEDSEFLETNGGTGFTTLDEADGANYVRKELANEAVTADEANDRGEFDADDVTWTALGVGTRQYTGIIVYKHVGADAVNIPIYWIDSGGFPFWGNGGNVTAQWNAEGIGQVT